VWPPYPKTQVWGGATLACGEAVGGPNSDDWTDTLEPGTLDGKGVICSNLIGLTAGIQHLYRCNEAQVYSTYLLYTIMQYLDCKMQGNKYSKCLVVRNYAYLRQTASCWRIRRPPAPSTPRRPSWTKTTVSSCTALKEDVHDIGVRTNEGRRSLDVFISLRTSMDFSNFIVCFCLAATYKAII
jgi:hypothetical protein